MSGGQLRTIMLVEDEPDIRAIVKVALEAIGGHQVIECAGGGEAVARAEAGIRPDLILLDVMMPGLDGPATLARLRALAATREAPVVFMTARVQPGEVNEYLALGAVGVIAKPFDPLQLPASVAELWRKHRDAAV